MKTFMAAGTNEMMRVVYSFMGQHGHTASSRNGMVLTIDDPICMTYHSPKRMVNLCPIRDANPFFHLVEGLAMIAGINSVALLSEFNSNIASFSDDGQTFNAFYGTRMEDQVDDIVNMLQKDPHTRQAVIQLWDKVDLTKETKDKACNMSLVFRIVQGKVDMTIFCRSNDLIWGGVSGANMAHFPMIHEHIARRVGRRPGRLHHVVNNAHIYLDNPKWPQLLKTFTESIETTVPFTPSKGQVKAWFTQGVYEADDFLHHVASPMVYAFTSRDVKVTEKILDPAWREASKNWLERRAK